jgi:5-bromo-4-chloroindolyl phosphate hydrolysis protein
MKLGLLFLFLMGIGCKDSTIVYVCDSPNAGRYHLKEHCRGLSNCSYRTVKVTEEEAKKEGKTLCRWEDKNK